ncbi:RHS repeat-associated core domain-containing protein [Fibrobacter sp.]|uniref:RHS repeat domain-containing protein n=1 Tax=Fibrobacter sp. TaxID=35828 RepID=UPI0025C3EA8A|nr:RHS repeat-associated core domain-containing protein [Fibrobacter sp.]
MGFLCENVADPDALLEPETFTTVTAYDALNRATSIRTPHNAGIPASEILPGYNEASLLEKVDVKLRGAATATNFVQNIDYDAKGQRERIQYGNGSTTGYTYDEKTFRLKRLLTTRNNGADVLQDLNYTYDAVGNVTQIDDSAQQTIFFNGSVVSPSQKFEYDALYRLIKATGREHVSVNADSEPEAEGYNAAQISPQDGSAMRNYSREWEYDSVGNILSIIHQANGNAWTRTNAYATDSNRLTGTTVGSASANFSYNAHGSMTSMPHLSAMDWDFAEKLCHITRGTTEAYYNYDGNGIRTRKVVEKNGVVETRLYLGGFEIWRKTVNGVLDTERETLHVMDDQRRIAIVETLTVENGNRAATPVPVQRYQLDNHLGSASLELDASANVISYEEYYPYGDTSYRAGRNASEVSRKRYRYTGKEKDEESSLYYCEQRYYAAHISRWVSTDPTWLEDGINLYAYVHGNPLSGVDPSGTNEENVVEDECTNQPSEVAQRRADAAKTMVEQYQKNKTVYSMENRQFGIDAQYSDCSSLVSSILEYAGQGDLFQAKHTGRGSGLGIQGEIQKKEGVDDLRSPYRMKNPKIGDIMMWKGHIGLVTDVTEKKVLWANMGVQSRARIQSASLKSESELKKSAEIYSEDFWGFWTPIDGECNKLEEPDIVAPEKMQETPSSSSTILSMEDSSSSAQETSMKMSPKQAESLSQKMELKLNELKHELNRLTNPMNWILGR